MLSVDSVFTVIKLLITNINNVFTTVNTLTPCKEMKIKNRSNLIVD